MSGRILRCVTVVFLAIAMTACGKGEEKKAGADSGSARIYGKEDAACFAGIVRAADAKHMTSADFRNWETKLTNSKDKDWLNGFSAVYSKVTKIVMTHLGKTPEELHEAKLVTMQELNVIEGYASVSQESDASKADALSASACAHVGFTKGVDLN